MIPIAIVTVKKDGRPAYFYFQTDKQTIQFDLYRTGSGESLKYVLDKYNKVKELLLWAMAGQILSPNIGSLLRVFDLPEIQPNAEVYDIGMPPIQALDKTEQDAKLCAMIAKNLQEISFAPYQLILGRAQSAYYGLEKAKLQLNYATVEPKWSMETFSGRSKSTNFNVQGWSEPDKIHQPSMSQNCVLLHFDWICADLRATSILSQDPALHESFISSDPYSYLSTILSGNKETLREEAKILLLKTINNLEYDNEHVRKAYPVMCDWLRKLLTEIRDVGKSYNIVGRPFVVTKERKERSVLNAVLQGSVASAMQSVMWKVRRLFSDNIVCDIHDGLVMALNKDAKAINRTVTTVSDIFGRPFEGILNNDPYFPHRISMGEMWKEWKVIKEVRLK